jgi:hypothetical protein
MTKLELDAFL